MSKPQVKPTAQVKNGSKTTTSVLPKKSTSNAVSKATSGISKTSNTQLKPTATSAPKKRATDEKDKLKYAGSSNRSTPTVPATRSKIQTTVGTKSTIKTGNAPTTRSTITTRQSTTLPAKKLIPSQSSRIGQEREQPVRAKRDAEILEAVRKNNAVVSKKVKVAKPNAVLDSFHNVTVSSPPPRRKEATAVAIESEFKVQEEPPKRVRTHTLDDEEIIVLRSDSAKRRIEQEILSAERNQANEPNLQRKEPVAFEVHFAEPINGTTLKSKPSREASRTRGKTEIIGNIEDANSTYSDDFESYESDFESGSGSQNYSPMASESDEATTNESVDLEGSGSDPEDGKTTAPSEEEEEEDETELTQYPITVIQRDKDRERKLDSGHYEINIRTQTKLAKLGVQGVQQLQQFDSLDTSCSITTTSEQLDSGISSYGNVNGSGIGIERQRTTDLDIVSTQSGYAYFNSRPVFSERGAEIMSKVQFDTLTFTLFEMKPISYDIYMQTYGRQNTTQSATQTNENRLNSESQTEEYDVRNMWTQHPAQYDLTTVQRLGTGLNGITAVQNCCGEAAEDELLTQALNTTEVYEVSLRSLASFRQRNGGRTLSLQLRNLQKPIDFERLNVFLRNATMLMSKVLNSKQEHNEQKRLLEHPERPRKTCMQSITAGYFLLNTSFLNALRVVRIFANPKYDIIITVHESLPDVDVYRSDFSNLLMVWSTSECSQPIRLLSTWSEVCRAEICNEYADIIVCGLRDGSIAMWDLRETYSYCSKLDGYLTHFAATQSVIPQWISHEEQNKDIVDLGAVVDVKSFRAPPKALGLSTALTNYRSIQFTSLNDTGILTIWTLIETTTKHYELDASNVNKALRQKRSRNSPTNQNWRFEYISPWARVKLIQSAICDLRVYLERGVLKAQTKFEKTKSLFQKNIYSDEVLRELNSSESELRTSSMQSLQGLRFTSIDTGCERVYVCTNRNFVLGCSKSLKMERFRKININEGRFLFPTALRVLTNEDFLAIGLSNGSVMIVNCNQHKLSTQQHTSSNGAGSSTINQYYPNDTSDVDPDTGKSCAIQNIILNERRLPDSPSGAWWQHDEQRPNTAAYINLISNHKRPFELCVYDQQILLNGSTLRKDLVQSLELSSDGWRLFALANGEVRIYDFCLDREIKVNGGEPLDKQRILDITVAKTAQTAQHLVLFNAENQVEVHLLKQ